MDCHTVKHESILLIFIVNFIIVVSQWHVLYIVGFSVSKLVYKFQQTEIMSNQKKAE